MQRVDIVLVGDARTGKTMLSERFVSNTFRNEYVATESVDFDAVSDVTSATRAQIWDSSGNEKFAPLVQQRCCVADVVLAVYSNDTGTLKWVDDARKHVRPNTIFAIVANKIDLETSKSETSKTAKALAQKHGFLFFETSAKSGYGVNAMFVLLVNLILQRRCQFRVH